jgi:hypothetical protein
MSFSRQPIPVRDHPLIADPSDIAPSSINPQSLPGGVFWNAAHPCPHCLYTHIIAFDRAPLAETMYVYTCPVAKRESRFAGASVATLRLAAPVSWAIRAGVRLNTRY